MSPPPKKLLDQACAELAECVRDQIQVKGYSSRTEEAYAFWVRELILLNKVKSGSFHHPGEMGISEVKPFAAHSMRS